MNQKIIFSKSTKNETSPSFKFDDPKSDLKELMKRYDHQTNLIISVLIVSFILMLIMVGTLVIDSSHINSATYKEYSQKTESVEITQKINQELLDQNKKNQETIINLVEKLKTK